MIRAHQTATAQGFPTGHHLLSESHRRAFPRVGLAMSFGSSSPAVLEDRLQSVGVSENKAGSLSLVVASDDYRTLNVSGSQTIPKP